MAVVVGGGRLRVLGGGGSREEPAVRAERKISP